MRKALRYGYTKKQNPPMAGTLNKTKAAPERRGLLRCERGVAYSQIFSYSSAESSSSRSAGFDIFTLTIQPSP